MRVSDEKAMWWMNRSHAAPFYLTTLFVIVLVYAIWFAVRIYPLIPFSLGGGKPRTIVFVEGDKKLPDEIKKSDQSAKRSMPYKLLLETDSITLLCRQTLKKNQSKSAAIPLQG